ncbi:MAG: hypothetical protein AAB935_01805 [Patescibacteria group bacterium]
MSLLLRYNLIGHVVLGLLGVIVFYAAWLALLKQNFSLKFLRFLSGAGLTFFLLSLLSGGYYYVQHYGNVVKPIIKAGRYPWAHSVIMETKEHVFLFLPFLAAVVFLVFWLLGERIGEEPKLKRPLVFLVGLIAVLGIAILMAGITISGAAR